MEADKRFNIRVYGILINDRGEVLLSDEDWFGEFFTKFPGGGLEFGEGLKDCLRREYKEEVGINIEIGELFYLTDYFQRSAFDENSQIVSVYYLVSSKETDRIVTVNEPFQGIEDKKEVQRWQKLSEFSADDIDYPIDKLVAKKLIEDLTKN